MQPASEPAEKTVYENGQREKQKRELQSLPPSFEGTFRFQEARPLLSLVHTSPYEEKGEIMSP